MSNRVTQSHQQPGAERPPFRHTRIAAVVAGLVLITANPLYAADDQVVSNLQAEILQLKQALEKSQQELAAQRGQAPTPQAPSSAPASDAAVATEAAASTPSLLEDFIVKARKRNILETVQAAPKSVSIVSGDELAQEGALNVKDIFKNVGNIKWDYGNAKTNAITIRGVSTTGGSTEQIIPDLGMTVDGVPYGYVPFITGSDFVDLQSVSIARGPQGATGGLNSTMGTLNITTKQPSFTPEANASITFGQQKTLITQAAVGGSIVDGLLAFRTTFYRDQADGYYANTYTPIAGRPNSSYNNVDRTYGRAQFLLTPSDNFSATISIDDKPVGVEMINGLTVRRQTPATYADGSAFGYVAKNDPLAVFSRPYFNNRGYSAQTYYNGTINENQNMGISSGTRGASAKLDWTVLGGYKLESISAYRDEYFQAGNDEGTPFDITYDSGLFVHYTQRSQELSVSSPVEPNRLVDFKVGVVYVASKSDATSRTNYGADAGAFYANNSQYYGTGTSATAIAPGFVTGVNAGSGLGANSAGLRLLQDSLNGANVSTVTTTDNQNLGLYGQGDWHLTDKLTLTTGLRLTEIENNTSQGKVVYAAGAGADLNPVAQGGFTSAATLVALQAANSAAQLNEADRVANTYYGSTVTATPGAAYASLTAAQKTQVASAQAIRAANPYLALYAVTPAAPSNTFQPTGNISLSYKLFDDNLTPYLAYQRGGKGGLSQISAQLTKPTTSSAGTGRSLDAQAETTNAFELGVKASFLNKTLLVNADVFRQYLYNFQQSTVIADPASITQSNPQGYLAVTGNVPVVNVKGLELDAAYVGIPYTTLRVAGAYNDATYGGGTRLGQPVENGYTGAALFRNVDGMTLPNASKYTADISAMYRHPVFGDKEFHTNINYSYQSSYNADAALSNYAWVKAYGTADFGIGIGRQDKLFDANILVKNLFDKNYANNPTWNSYVPTTNPRWIGIVFSSKL